MSSRDRDLTLRRRAQQIVHTAEEALSVLIVGEDTRCALDDLEMIVVSAKSVIEDLRQTERSWRPSFGEKNLEVVVRDESRDHGD